MTLLLNRKVSVSYMTKLIFFIGLLAINISMIKLLGLIVISEVLVVFYIIITLFSVSIILLNIRKTDDRILYIKVFVLFAFYLYLIISSFSGDLQYGFTKAYVGVLLPTTLSVFFIPYRWKKDQILSAFTIAIILISLFAIFYKYQYGFYSRAVNFGLFGPITYGWFMSFGVLSVLMMEKKIKYRIILYVFFFLQLLWTGSKGPLFALLFILLLYNRRAIIIFMNKYYYLIVPLILFLFYLNYITTQNNSGVMEIRQLNTIIQLLDNPKGYISEGGAGSIGVRISVIHEALYYFSKEPIIGHGFGSFPELTKSHLSYPHNVFIEVLVETGIFGLILFVFVLLALIYGNSLKWFGYFGVLILSFSGDVSYLRYIIFLLLIGHFIDMSPKNSKVHESIS